MKITVLVRHHSEGLSYSDFKGADIRYSIHPTGALEIINFMISDDKNGGALFAPGRWLEVICSE